MAEFDIEKRRVDRFETEIKRICGEVFINTAPIQVDTQEATDLLVLSLNPIRIACRVRRYSYYNLYRNEFTIRSKLGSGHKTELSKIIEGWCDYNFYGFADQKDESLIDWMIGDLKVFRLEYMRALYVKSNGNRKGRIQWFEKKNIDKSHNSFLSFKINSFPKHFVISQKSSCAYGNRLNFKEELHEQIKI